MDERRLIPALSVHWQEARPATVWNAGLVAPPICGRSAPMSYAHQVSRPSYRDTPSYVWCALQSESNRARVAVMASIQIWPFWTACRSSSGAAEQSKISVTIVQSKHLSEGVSDRCSTRR